MVVLNEQVYPHTFLPSRLQAATLLQWIGKHVQDAQASL
jgi:hypothetical protein